ARTRHPSAFSARAQCAPMPDDAPVTRMVPTAVMPPCTSFVSARALPSETFPFHIRELDNPGRNRHRFFPAGIAQERDAGALPGFGENRNASDETAGRLLDAGALSPQVGAPRCLRPFQR